MLTSNRNKALYSLLSVLLVMIIALPVLYVGFQIFRFPFLFPEDALNLIISDRILNLLGKSILLALLVMLLTSLISLPLAYTFANFSFPLKKTFFILILIPFFIPPYIYAISWIDLLGDSGLLQSLDISIYGFWGSVFVLTCWLFPLSFFFFMSSVRINIRLEEAAKLIKSKSNFFFKITFPIILPGILAGMVFTFILAITNFGVPGALRLNVYPYEIFIQFGAFFNHLQAIFLSFPQVLLSVIFILFFLKKYGGLTEKSEQKRTLAILKNLSTGQKSVFYILTGFLIVIVIVLPMISLLLGSRSLDVLLSAVSDNLAEIWNSVFYNLVSAISLTIAGFYLAFFRRSLKISLLKTSMDLLILLIITIPGTVFGILLIKFAQINAFSAIMSTPFATVILSNIRYLPVSYFICVAGLSRLPEKYLEAAWLTSQGKMATFRKILLPLNKDSILGSLIIVFVLCFGELDSAIMIYPPGFETMPIRIYSLLHYGANEMVSALSFVQALIILVFFATGYKWIRKIILYDA